MKDVFIISKEKLIELVREEILFCTETLTEENLSEMLDSIQSQLKVLDAINQAKFKRSPRNLMKKIRMKPPKNRNV